MCKKFIVQQSTTNFTAKCYYNPLMFSKNAQAKKQLLIEAAKIVQTILWYKYS